MHMKGIREQIASKTFSVSHPPFVTSNNLLYLMPLPVVEVGARFGPLLISIPSLIRELHAYFFSFLYSFFSKHFSWEIFVLIINA